LEGERRLTCFCGLAAATAEELDAHFLALFTPDDAIGRDGKKHHPITTTANDAERQVSGGQCAVNRGPFSIK
jgi:hypothetical protein